MNAEAERIQYSIQKMWMREYIRESAQKQCDNRTVPSQSHEHDSRFIFEGATSDSTSSFIVTLAIAEQEVIKTSAINYVSPVRKSRSVHSDSGEMKLTRIRLGMTRPRCNCRILRRRTTGIGIHRKTQGNDIHFILNLDVAGENNEANHCHPELR